MPITGDAAVICQDGNHDRIVLGDRRRVGNRLGRRRVAGPVADVALRDHDAVAEGEKLDVAQNVGFVGE